LTFNDWKPIEPKPIGEDQETQVSPSDQAPKPTPRTAKLGDLIGEFLVDVEARKTAKDAGRNLGAVVPFPELNKAIGEYLPIGFNALLGSPGSGKSALALQIAAECGCPALYVSCEMSAVEQLRRIIARVNGVAVGRLKDGSIDPADAESLAQRAAAACPDLAIADATTAYASREWIVETAARIRGKSDHFLLVLDSLHSWLQGSEDDRKEYDAMNADIGWLQTFAKRSGAECAVLAITEQNRASMTAKSGDSGGSGGLNSGAGTRKIEYAAELILTIESGKKDETLASGDRPRTLILSKNRNGDTGKRIEMGFAGGYMRWKEL
jgi:replicative DNA helicase